MKNISLCMIVKDEQKTLQRCIDSIKDFVDEIIIVDTGSKDNTKQIARQFTDKVYDFVWCDNFSLARNYALSKASKEYIMWLDADDIVPPRTLNFLVKNKSKMTCDTYMLKYDVAFTDGKPTYSFYRERILKNDSRCFWQGAVHEYITPFGKVVKLNIAIEHRKEKLHDKNRNLKIYNKLKKQKIFNAREQYYYSRELFDHQKYKLAITNFQKLIKMKDAWIENVIEAHYLLSICYNKQNNHKKEIEILFSTFLYDTPRANICYRIASYFYQAHNYDNAIYWFIVATKCKDVIDKGAFVDNRFYNYYPYLGLCCAYYQKGDIKNAIYYNNKAGEYFLSKEVEYNKKLFEQTTNVQTI